jgi:hypothetical protein
VRIIAVEQTKPPNSKGKRWPYKTPTFDPTTWTRIQDSILDASRGAIDMLVVTANHRLRRVIHEDTPDSLVHKTIFTRNGDERLHIFRRVQPLLLFLMFLRREPSRGLYDTIRHAFKEAHRDVVWPVSQNSWAGQLHEYDAYWYAFRSLGIRDWN